MRTRYRPDEEHLGVPPGSPPRLPTGPPDMAPEALPGPPPGMEDLPPTDDFPPMESMEPMMDEAALPSRGEVMKVDGEEVHVKSDDGSVFILSVSDFPFPPDEGDRLVKAKVDEIEGEMMVVTADGVTTNLPARPGFNVGDFFWMPEPPGGPPEEEKDVGPSIEAIIEEEEREKI